MTRPATRLFVLTIGRSGSTAFAAACGHSTRFTVGHESNADLFLPERICYPPMHIEIDNRLVHYVELLKDQYGDDAAYVYLSREPEAIVDSYVRRWHLSISAVRAHGISTLMRAGSVERGDRQHIARDYVRLMDARIRWHVARSSHGYLLRSDELRSELPRFWTHFGLGDGLEGATCALGNRYNLNTHTGTNARLRRMAAKSERILRALPAFLADA